MIKINNLTKKYERDRETVTVLQQLNLLVDEGEIVSIMGPSGVGKTTLLNIIAGLDTDIDGDVEVEGRHLQKLSLSQLAVYRNKTIGFIFQEFNLLPHLNALENALVPLMFADISHSEAEKKALNALETVGLKEMAQRYPSELSGGQKQRVAIARALINRPKVILADEPTANLDADTEKSIIKLITRLAEEEKATLIIATHNGELASLAQRIFTIEELQGGAA
ncbi:MAG TPA: ABC transporter ATP-binding protein [Acidobacteriota bacterium]|nr:ABC transporter ATP-binding protein [Acidobacteriota bacterium]